MATDLESLRQRNRTRLFDREIASGRREEHWELLSEQLDRGKARVYFCNVHMLMLAREDTALAGAMDSATLVLPDGVPISWLQRQLGTPDAEVLRGYEAVEAICCRAAEKSLPIGFLGSTERVLDALKKNLQDRYRGLKIEFLHAPGPIEDPTEVSQDLVETVNERRLYCLFVGLGCPKQELWIQHYAPHIDCSLLAVGAAFNWLAGSVSKPPSWMEQSGLGWLFRLAQDPKRMWHRYLKFNSQFIMRSTALLFMTKVSLLRRAGKRR